MKPDIVSVIEASYEIEGKDDLAWLGELLARARPSIDRGMGVAAYFADLTRPDYAASEPVGLGLPDGWQRTYEAMVSREIVTPEIRRRLADPTPVVTLSQNLGKRLFAALRPLHRRVAYPFGFRDWLGIKVLDPTAKGIIMCAPLPRVTRLSPTMVASWSRIAGHISAGYRLRRRLAVAGEAPAGAPGATDWSRDAEAILHPSGRTVLHAATPAKSRNAREALQAAAQQIDRARGRLRRADPEEAVSIWLGLVAGRWSLVDQVDRDGKRYLLAHRNDPPAAGGGARRVTARERQVLAYAALGHPNKLIAYELGIVTSTVSMLLARAQAKLGASSRSQLVALWRAAMASDPGGDGEPRP